MNEITMIDFLALRLDIPRMELKNPAFLVAVLQELVDMPAGMYPVKDWNITVSYLYRDHYYFSSIEKAKSFAKEEIIKHAPKKRVSQKVMHIWRAWRLPLACGLVVYLLMQHIFLFCFIPSASMEPTIEEGSFILALRIYGKLDRGDVVIFDRYGALLVKRIAAIEGETVYLDDKTGAYSLVPMETASRILVVPAGSLFLVGDNEENSLDSRFWADPFVDRNSVVAKWVGT